MALVGSNLLTNETQNSAGSGSFTTSGTFAGAPNTLTLVAVQATSDSGAWTGSPTLSGGGMSSWTLKTTVVNASTQLLFVFHSVDASPGAAAALTFTCPASETMSSCHIAADQITGSTITGTNGADAFIQEKTVTQGSGVSATTTAAYDGAFASGNGGYAAFSNNTSPQLSTPRTGWTELADFIISGKSALCTHWRADEDTAASSTSAANSNGGRCGVAYEIETAGAASTTGNLKNTGIARAMSRGFGRAMARQMEKINDLWRTPGTDQRIILAGA